MDIKKSSILFIFLCCLALFAIYSFHFLVLPSDIAFYHESILENSNLRQREALERTPAEIRRKGIKKIFLDKRDSGYSEISIESSESLLTVSQKKRKMQVIERLSDTESRNVKNGQITTAKALSLTISYPRLDHQAKDVRIDCPKGSISGKQAAWFEDAFSQTIQISNEALFQTADSSSFVLSKKASISGPKNASLRELALQEITLEAPRGSLKNHQTTFQAIEGRAKFHEKTFRPQYCNLYEAVELSSLTDNEECFAVADKAQCRVLEKMILLESTPPSKVLLKKQGMVASAPALLFQKGIHFLGDAHILLSDEEQHLFEKLLHRHSSKTNTQNAQPENS